MPRTLVGDFSGLIDALADNKLFIGLKRPALLLSTKR